MTGTGQKKFHLKRQYTITYGQDVLVLVYQINRLPNHLKLIDNAKPFKVLESFPILQINLKVVRASVKLTLVQKHAAGEFFAQIHRAGLVQYSGFTYFCWSRRKYPIHKATALLAELTVILIKVQVESKSINFIFFLLHYYTKIRII